MAAKYTKQQHTAAKELGQKLVMIDAGGLEFSGPVTNDEHMEVTRFLLAFLDRRRSRDATSGEPKES